MDVGVIEVEAQRLIRLLARLEEHSCELRVLPKQRLAVDGAPSGGGAGPGVPINVAAMDLADQIHSVLVSWAEQVAEQMREDPPAREFSSWAVTPSGAQYAIRGWTSRVVDWLRQRATWIVQQDWFFTEAWPELNELRRRAERMLGIAVPAARTVDLALEIAAGRHVEWMEQRGEG